VHGEKHNMLRLKSKLLSLNASKPAHLHTKVYSPQNCEELRIPFHIAKTAKVVGSLAQTQPPRTADPEDTRLLSGVLVQNGFNLSLMAPEDLKEYAGLTTTTIMCKQHLTLGAAGIDLVKWALESTFGAIEVVEVETHQNGKPEANGKSHDEEPADEEISMDDSCSFLVMGCVTVRYDSRRREVELEWEGNMVNDGIADAVMCVLLSVETSPAAVKCMPFSSLPLSSHPALPNITIQIPPPKTPTTTLGTPRPTPTRTSPPKNASPASS
jgi:cleavage and polyadenylation specificity factor subunit 3